MSVTLTVSESSFLKEILYNINTDIHISNLTDLTPNLELRRKCKL